MTKRFALFFLVTAAGSAQAQQRVVPLNMFWSEQPAIVGNDPNFVNIVRLYIHTGTGTTGYQAANDAADWILGDIAAGRLNPSNVCILFHGWGHDNLASASSLRIWRNAPDIAIDDELFPNTLFDEQGLEGPDPVGEQPGDTHTCTTRTPPMRLYDSGPRHSLASTKSAKRRRAIIRFLSPTPPEFTGIPR